MTTCYEKLLKQAMLATNHREDSEDLVHETYLITKKAIDGGKKIDDIEDYLFGTLQKRISIRYMERGKQKKRCKNFEERMAEEMTVVDSSSEADEIEKIKNAFKIRKELAFLAKPHRLSLYKFYFEKKSIEIIAHELKTSITSVKYWLLSGKKYVKDEFTLNEHYGLSSISPKFLTFDVSGITGLDGFDRQPATLLEQNILILANNNPLTVVELSKLIGTPTAFTEEIVEKLHKEKHLKKSGIKKYYADFSFIDQEQLDDALYNLYIISEKILFDVNDVYKSLYNEHRKCGFLKSFNDTQLNLYCLYTLSNHIRHFMIDSCLLNESNFNVETNEVIKYGIISDVSNGYIPDMFLGGKRVMIDYCFDFIEWDSPFGRTYRADFSSNFSNRERARLLYHIHYNENIDELFIPYISDLIKHRFLSLSSNTDKPFNVIIPVLTINDFEKVKLIDKKYSDELIKKIGDKIISYVKQTIIKNGTYSDKQLYSKNIGYMSVVPIVIAKMLVDEGVFNINESEQYPVSLLIKT